MFPLNEQPFVCRVALVGATCDLPAKAAVMNMVQYNGYYGCGRCLQQGIQCISNLSHVTICMCQESVFVVHCCVFMFV